MLKVVVDHGRQRHDPRRPCKIWNDEPVQVVVHRPRQELTQRSVLADVSLLHRRQVRGLWTLSTVTGGLSTVTGG